MAAATQNDFCHVAKHVCMSPSATPATRNEATRHLKPPKVTAFAELAIGTAIRTCGRLRTVANVNVTSSEHTLNPQTPRVKREPLLATYLGKKNADFQQSSNSTHEYVQKSIRNIFLKQVLLQ